MGYIDLTRTIDEPEPLDVLRLRLDYDAAAPVPEILSDIADKLAALAHISREDALRQALLVFVDTAEYPRMSAKPAVEVDASDWRF